MFSNSNSASFGSYSIRERRSPVATVVLGVAVAVAVSLTSGTSRAAAQMTFSDGWGKRSAPSVSRPNLDMIVSAGAVPQSLISEFDSNMDDKETRPPWFEPVDECHRTYMENLVKLHLQMMRIYASHAICQKKTLTKSAAVIEAVRQRRD